MESMESHFWKRMNLKIFNSQFCYKFRDICSHLRFIIIIRCDWLKKNRDLQSLLFISPNYANYHFNFSDSSKFPYSITLRITKMITIGKGGADENGQPSKHIPLIWHFFKTCNRCSPKFLSGIFLFEWFLIY